jgi:hypothetical protein
MISERTFAASFNDFWNDLLPLLTPSFVHNVNLKYEQPILNNEKNFLLPVTEREETRDPAIIAEFAYHLFAASISNQLPLASIIDNKEMITEVQRKAFALTDLYEGTSSILDSSLNQDELDEGHELCQRYEAFILQSGSSIVEIPLLLRGSGFLNECNADMLLDDYLVEVKTVKRKVSAKDIRQLIIYLALNYASTRKVQKYAGFLNPRRSKFLKFISLDLIEQMSGGRAAVDVFTQLTDFTCFSDVLFDSQF